MLHICFIVAFILECIQFVISVLDHNLNMDIVACAIFIRICDISIVVQLLKCLSSIRHSHAQRTRIRTGHSASPCVLSWSCCSAMSFGIGGVRFFK